MSLLSLSIEVVLLMNVAFLNVNCLNECLQTNSTDGLPPFVWYRAPPEKRIQNRHQAIIPAYKLTCCGNITKWGVNLNPPGPAGWFNFDLQVWRPSPTVSDDGSGCYRLVSNYNERSISRKSDVARVTPSVQLQFKPGDVLGFYVESHGTDSDYDNGVVLLDNSTYINELVWYANFTQRESSRIQNGSCPSPVGSRGVLNSSTHAAPVISISTIAYACPQSFSTVVSVPPKTTITNRNSNALLSFTTESIMRTTSLSVPTVRTPDVESNSVPLIAGAVAAFLVFCIILTIFMMVVVVIVKKHRTRRRAIGQAFDNQVYDHSDPDTPLQDNDEQSHIYQCAEARCEREAAQNQHAREALPYAVPNKEFVVETGIYVPTTDERSCWEGHYETCYELSTNIYNKTSFFIEEQIYWTPANTTDGIYSQLASKKYREIPRDQIRTTRALGSGEFGEVHKALWSISGATKEVAVKTLKPGSSEKDRVRFLQEAAIMGQFNHPNVVKLYGVVTMKDPIMICIELMSRGDLRGYLVSLHPLHKQPTISEIMSQQLKFSKQIASGMAYLSRKAFVHRDLAARNVLLDDSLNCKISDFGMARDLADDTYYTVQSKGNKIPVKWTAPEALLYKKYSPDSDVWSYGMVLFEIWSAGRKPFSNMTNQQVLKKIDSGYCQPPPPGCPRAIYKIMVDCWNPIHSQRPSFAELYSSLKAPKHTLLEWNEVAEPNRLQQAGQEVYQDLQYSYLRKE